MDHSILDHTFKTNPSRAIEMLYGSYYGYLCNQAYKIVFDHDTAEDIVQEVITELWVKRNDFLNDLAILPYLKRSLYNRAINRIKKKKWDDIDTTPINELSQEISTAQHFLEEQELASRIDAAIKDLPEKCRAVFALSRYQEKSYKEISDDLSISVKTVENQISKALKTLREKVFSKNHDYE